MKSFLKRMWPTMKFALIIMGLQLALSLFAMALGGIGENIHIAWRLLLALVFVVGVVGMVFAYTRNFAYDEFNRRQNNRARERNNEVVDDNMRGREYVWYKGYVVGAACSALLIILNIVTIFAPNAACSLICFCLYGSYLFPISLIIAPLSHPAFNFIAVIFIFLVPGITYHLQGLKMQKGLEKRNDSRVKK